MISLLGTECIVDTARCTIGKVSTHIVGMLNACSRVRDNSCALLQGHRVHLCRWDKLEMWSFSERQRLSMRKEVLEPSRTARFSES